MGRPQGDAPAVTGGILADAARARAEQQPAARALWQVDALGPADGARRHARHL